MRSRSGAVVGLYALLALLAVPVFPHFLSPNEFTRWALAASLVERGTPEISSVLPLLGPAFEDVSEKDGRVYSNKAPGAALVALPGYLARAPVRGAAVAASMRPVLWAMRLFGATLPALLLALVLVHAAVRFGASPSRAASAAFALLFATPLFAYGLLLFSHALVAACLFGGVGRALRSGRSVARVPPRRRSRARSSVSPCSRSTRRRCRRRVLVLCAVIPAPRRALALAAGGAPFAAAPRRVRSRSASAESSSCRPRTSARAGFPVARVGGPLRHRPAVSGRRSSPPRSTRRRVSSSSSPFLLLWPGAFRAVRARRVPAGGRARARPRPSLAPPSLRGLPELARRLHGRAAVSRRGAAVSRLPVCVPGGGDCSRARSSAPRRSPCCATTLAFPFVPPGFALPWGSFAAFFFERGLTAPNVLHLVAPAAARFALPAIVAVAAYCL